MLIVFILSDWQHAAQSTAVGGQNFLTALSLLTLESAGGKSVKAVFSTHQE